MTGAGEGTGGRSLWLVMPFLFFSLFPYIKTVPLPIDTQPTGLLLGMLLIVFARHHQASAGVWILGGIVASATLLFVTGETDLSAVRNILGYLSLFVFAYLFFNISLSERVLLARFVEVAILVWFLVGLMQVAVGRSFLTFLVSDARTTESRGVTSLAPEPSYYASQMLFLLLMHLMLGAKRHILALGLLAILLLALSSQVVLVILLAVGASMPFLFGRRGFLGVTVAMLAAAGLGFALFDQYKDQIRILSLIDLVLRNPTTLLLVDASANERFAAIYVSFKSFLDNFLLPHGISGNIYYEAFVDLKRRYPEFLWAAQPNRSNLSGAGRLAFELGPLFFLFVGIVVAGAWKLKAPPSVRMFVLSAYLLLLVTAIPLAHPMLGAVLGVLLAGAYANSPDIALHRRQATLSVGAPA